MHESRPSSSRSFRVDDPPGRRTVLRAAAGFGLGLLGLTACGPDEGAGESAGSPTTGPLDPPSPIRTPAPDAHVRDVFALSSADLDVLSALEVDPVAAWAEDGTGPRPWRPGPAPPAPGWDGPGLPTLRALLPFGAGAFALAAADVSEAQMRAYEQLAVVIADPAGRPGWREHLELVASATGTESGPAAETTEGALGIWAAGQRHLGVAALSVVIATGARPDTSVATLDAGSPLCREIRELGFDVVSRPGPVAYRELRDRGVQVVRVDPRDADLVAAVRQPSVLSLPWSLAALTRGRRPV